MANPNTPYGLRPYAYAWGGPYNGAVSTYYVPASNGSNLFLGDPVALIGNSADANGVPAVQIATAGAGNYILGPVLGVSNNAGSAVITVRWDTPVYIPSGTAAYVYVADDINLVHAIQEDSVGGAMAAGAGGGDAALVAGSGSTVTGMSGWMLDSSTLSHSVVNQMRVMRALQQIDNAVGVNAKWLCRIQQASWTASTPV